MPPSLLAARLAAVPRSAETSRLRVPRMSVGVQPSDVLSRLHDLGLSGMADGIFPPGGRRPRRIASRRLADAFARRRGEGARPAPPTGSAARRAAALSRLGGECRLLRLARSRPDAISKLGRRPLDRQRDEPDHRRPHRARQKRLACALGQKACRDDRSVLYQRVSQLFADLALARGSSRYPRLMRAVGSVDLLILDDWGLEPLDASSATT